MRVVKAPIHLETQSHDPIRSVATGNQWSGPIQSKYGRVHWPPPLVSKGNWLGRKTESKVDLGFDWNVQLKSWVFDVKPKSLMMQTFIVSAAFIEDCGYLDQNVHMSVCPGSCSVLLSLPAHLHVVGMLQFKVFDINQPSLPTPFFLNFNSVLVSVSAFMALSTVFQSINSPDISPLSHSILPVLFLLYRSFQLHISFWKAPPALI